MISGLRIAELQVGLSHPPLVIAELSGNHNQSLERALAIVKAAADAGAQALKLQTYTPDTMTIDLDEREFHISDPKSLWAGVLAHVHRHPRLLSLLPTPVQVTGYGCQTSQQ